MTLATDPFTTVYNALWDLAEAHEGFAGIVKVANRIDFAAESNTDPIKRNIQVSDMPEVGIEPAGGGFEIISSTSGRAVQQFAVVIITGDLRISKYLFPVKWQVLRMLVAAPDNLSLPYVTNIRVTDVAESLDDDERKRGTAGWVALMTISVEMAFNRKIMELDKTGAI